MPGKTLMQVCSIITFSLFVSSCNGYAVAQDSRSSSEPRKNLFLRIRDGLVRVGQAKRSGKVEVERWLGTGFFVDEICTVATAKHLFRNADKERIIIQFQLPTDRSKIRTIRAMFLYQISNKDIAFLRAIHPKKDSCSLGNLKSLQLIKDIDKLRYLCGEDIIIAGYPALEEKALDVPIARGGLIASSEIQFPIGNPMLILDLPGWRGYSGSPVILERTGEVVGIVYGPAGLKRVAGFEMATPITKSDYESAMAVSANSKKADHSMPN